MRCSRAMPRESKLDGKQLDSSVDYNDDIDIERKNEDLDPKQVSLSRAKEKKRLKRREKRKRKKEERRLYMTLRSMPMMGLSPIIRDPKTGKRKTYYEMTDAELVRLCIPPDFSRARRVVKDLRKYLIQVEESEGFDIDVYPGCFSGLTTIIPLKKSCWDPDLLHVAIDAERMGIASIRLFNSENDKTMFEFEHVQKMNVKKNEIYYLYYMTFRAREVNTPTSQVKTFQSVVEVHRLQPQAGFVSRVFSCRLSPKAMDHNTSSEVGLDEWW